MSIRIELKEQVSKSLQKLEISVPDKYIVIEQPKERNKGDYSTGIALVIEYIYKTNPMKIANDIAKNLKKDYISEIKITPPGYIDIFLTEDYLTRNLNKILEKGKSYGKTNYGNNEKISLRYRSKDNNCQVSISKSHGLSYLDNLSRIMTATGYTSTKDYYSKEETSKELNEALGTIRVDFDNYITSDQLIAKDYVEIALIELKKTNLCYVSDYLLILQSTSFGDKKDQILIDENGNYTDYLLDIAYYLNKLQEQNKLLIDVVEPDPDLEPKSLKIALKILGYDPKVLELVILPQNDKPLPYDDIRYLSDELDLNEFRYALASYKLNEQLPKELVNLKSSKLEYFKNYNFNYNNYQGNLIINKKYDTLTTAETYTIMSKLTDLEDIIILSMSKRNPQILIGYISNLLECLQKLDSMFKSINSLDNGQKALILSIKITVSNTLKLVGIIPTEY